MPVSLVQEDSTYPGTTKYTCHNYWALTPESMSCKCWSQHALEPFPCKERRHCSEKSAHHHEEWPPSVVTREKLAQQQRHSTAKNIFFFFWEKIPSKNLKSEINLTVQGQVKVRIKSATLTSEGSSPATLGSENNEVQLDLVRNRLMHSQLSKTTWNLNIGWPSLFF